MSTKSLALYLLSASLYVSKRGAYWDRLCRDVVGRWMVVTRVGTTLTRLTKWIRQFWYTGWVHGLQLLQKPDADRNEPVYGQVRETTDEYCERVGERSPGRSKNIVRKLYFSRQWLWKGFPVPQLKWPYKVTQSHRHWYHLTDHIWLPISVPPYLCAYLYRSRDTCKVK